MEAFETKICPQCGQELFSDMPVCYGCLYSFEEKPPNIGRLPAQLPEFDDLDEVEDPDAGSTSSGGEGSFAKAEVLGDDLMLRITTDDAQATIDIPRAGIVIGRDALCDVVLRSRAVSKRHARVIPLSTAVIVEDLGATNPVICKGREVRETAVVHRGESFEVCGATFTVV